MFKKVIFAVAFASGAALTIVGGTATLAYALTPTTSEVAVASSPFVVPTVTAGDWGE